MNKRIVDHGYSIAELMLVGAVIAIAAAATPSLSDVHLRRVDAAPAEVILAWTARP